MSKVYKTSRARVKTERANDRYVYLLESQNPEIRLAERLRDFLKTLGYSSLFPNFDNIRIGTVHPFAVLLAQEVLNQPQKTNLFPSITIADSTVQEDAEVLSDDYSLASWSEEDIVNIGGYREANAVFVSDAGWEKIQATIAKRGRIAGVTRQYHANHNLDFNVWSENKEVTSFLFDCVCHFVSQLRIDLHSQDGLDMAGISGRRSGDINLDYGKLLYGANVSVSMAMNQRATVFDTEIVDIKTVDGRKLPEYFTLKAV